MTPDTADAAVKRPMASPFVVLLLAERRAVKAVPLTVSKDQARTTSVKITRASQLRALGCVRPRHNRPRKAARRAFIPIANTVVAL